MSSQTKIIKRINVVQAAKVGAVIYFFATAIFIIPFGLIAEAAGGFNSPGFPAGGGAIMMILMPFFYAIFGFIGTAIGCAIYNLVAKWVGGVEIQVEEKV